MILKGLSATLALGLVLLPGCAAPPPRDHITLSGGSAGSAPGVSLYSGAVWMEKGSPGVLFGPATKPDSLQKPPYIALLKCPSKMPGSCGAEFSTQSDGASASAVTKVTADSAKISLEYQVKGDRNTGAIKNETLLVNGKPANLAAGSLLLIDLSGTSVKLRQLQMDLPAVPYQSSPETVTSAAKDVLAALTRQSADVRAFAK